MDKNQHEESTAQLIKADMDQNPQKATQAIEMDKNQQGTIIVPTHSSIYKAPLATSRKVLFASIISQSLLLTDCRDAG
jgi:hypothetical protein